MPTPKSSGTAYPTVKLAKPSTDRGRVPIPIALNAATIIKLVAPTIIAIVSALSGALYFYHQTRVHMDNGSIHLESGERSKLETKDEARVARYKMQSALKKETAFRAREIRLEHRESMQRMKTDQRRILREVQRTRRAVE